MIVRPNPLLLDSIRGPVGNVVFQRLHTNHIARRRWTIRAPATAGQAAHRLAVVRAAALYASVQNDVLPAWLLYAEALGYGAFAAWQHLNILPAKAGTVGAITPPNSAYTPIASPDWAPGGFLELDATWTYAGPGSTVFVSTYYRKANTFAWTYSETVDATAEAATIAGLDHLSLYEVALVPHTAAKLTWGQAYHELCYPGGPECEDFDTYTELDPSARIWPDVYTVHAGFLQGNEDAWLYDDKGVDAFGATWNHQFTWYWEDAQQAGCATFWAVSNTIEDALYWWNNNSQAIMLQLYKHAATCEVFFQDCETHEADSFAGFSLDTTLYPTVERTGETTLEARFYTDEARENLFHKLEIPVVDGRRYRYLFAINVLNSGSTDTVDFDITDLYLA